MNYGLLSKHAKVERSYHVSGTCDLPEGYRLAYVPPNALVEHVMPEVEVSRILQSSYSLASGVISIVQILSACSALYQSQGYQITAYGYAAFGFTVTPYLVMSTLNLLANCFTPSFPNVYLVQTEIMDEAISRGGRFTDIVGKLESEPVTAEDLTLFSASFEQRDDKLLCRIADKSFEDGTTEPIIEETTKHEENDEHSVSESTRTSSSVVESVGRSAPPDEETGQKQAVAVENDCSDGLSPGEEWEPTLIFPACYKFKLAYSNTSSTSILYRRKHYGRRGNLFGAIVTAVASLPFIPIGVMSKFRPGSSTLTQRAWLMAWYAVGIVSVQNPYFTDELVEFGYYGTRRIIKARKEFSRYRQARYFVLRLASLMGIFVLVTPAIGGFAVVGQMLVSYGTCTEI